MIRSLGWLKVALRGCKRFLPRGTESLPKVTCAGANKVCARATPCCVSATSLLLPFPQRPFAPSPKHFGPDQLIWPLSMAAWFASLLTSINALFSAIFHPFLRKSSLPPFKLARANLGFPAQFPAKKGPGNLTPKKFVGVVKTVLLAQTVILLGWHPPFSSFPSISGVR